jgi:hypothetical protein
MPKDECVATVDGSLSAAAERGNAMTNAAQTRPVSATTRSADDSSTPLTRLLSLAAVAGPILFVLAWLPAGWLRPGYSSVGQQISALAIGPEGAFVRTAFILNGLLLAVGAIAAFKGFKQPMGTAARFVCALTLLLPPLGMVWAGIFTMDALALHMVGVDLACAFPVIGFPVLGFLLRRLPAWRRLGTWILFGGPLLTVALTIGLMQSIPLEQMAFGGGTFGLWQRALSIEVQTWFALLGWRAFRLRGD